MPSERSSRCYVSTARVMEKCELSRAYVTCVCVCLRFEGKGKFVLLLRGQQSSCERRDFHMSDCARAASTTIAHD